ncbi:hypothetical protein EON77_10625 [bacterium]|nr:MAG: hypothetical protein EON77_10625 [bacterium]
MADILSKSEIEALISSLGTADASKPMTKGMSAPTPATTSNLLKGRKAPTGYELYDFRRPDKLSKDQLRTLQMLHETFARQAASSLSASLRSPVSIEMISLEQVPYDEYLRSIGNSVFRLHDDRPDARRPRAQRQPQQPHRHRAAAPSPALGAAVLLAETGLGGRGRGEPEHRRDRDERAVRRRRAAERYRARDPVRGEDRGDAARDVAVHPLSRDQADHREALGAEVVRHQRAEELA